jgi:hypothetical protein
MNAPSAMIPAKPWLRRRSIDPVLEEELFKTVLNGTGTNDGIDLMDGANDTKVLAHANSILQGEFVEPVARARILARVREYISQTPSAKDIVAARDAVDDAFYEVSESRGYDKGIEYATRQAYEVARILKLPPKRKIIDAFQVNVPDEDTYYVWRAVNGALTDLESAMDERQPSRRQAIVYARRQAAANVPARLRRRAVRLASEHADLKAVVESIPAAKKPDPEWRRYIDS